jgi:hypothetical protein
MANVELPEANRIVTQAFVLGWFENLHRFWGIMPPGLKLKTTSSQGNNVWGFTSRCQRAQDYEHERIRDMGYWNGHATGYPRVFNHTKIWGCNKT